MKKRYFSIIFILVFLFAFTGQAIGASLYTISVLDNNLVKVESLKEDKSMRIMVEKESEKYYYSLNKTVEIIPLQLGKGTYTIKILQNTSGDKYKVVQKQDINVTNNNLSEVYLASTQPVYWDDKEKVIELAQSLTKGKNTDMEKIESIYKYIVNNIKYDYNKIKGLSNDYVPEIDKVLDDKSGICYDYAALFAGMLRSLGIPTKLVKGYKSDLKEYHAWNQVLLDGNWVVIDTTYDAALKKDNVKISMIKDAIEYNNVREY
ncbi:transglutaminase-like domain-containing protein [Tissierella carlieri]|uniref:Transglutaminase-like domain-containing protein n=1 Tax=Tissierella carlieri TaxID=689904 RepID=A0ABT1SDB6_9FIRM|nr:transglutaminase-like domain-containing protein [Tissierella carlieri]MCQ4924468.1 transglutaminase-like domain-containing protein [Tissierella carlieri]